MFAWSAIATDEQSESYLLTKSAYFAPISRLFVSESDPRIGSALRSLGISVSSIVAAVIIMVPKLLEVEAIAAFVKGEKGVGCSVYADCGVSLGCAPSDRLVRALVFVCRDTPRLSDVFFSHSQSNVFTGI